MPINREAEDAWLDVAATDDEPTDLEWMNSYTEKKRENSLSYRYLAWMFDYTYPERVKEELWQVICKGCGCIIVSGPMKNDRGRVIKSGRELVMDTVETHILRGHVTPKYKRAKTPKECPF